MTSSRSIMVLLLVSAAVWSADTHTPAVHQRETAAKPASKPAAKPAARSPLSDAQLESAIRARFAKSKINSEKFQVRVQGGVATIEGRTDVIQHKGVATRMAKTAGAAAVNNRIQISDAA